MRAYWCPQPADMGVNPYWRLLRSELEAIGVTFDDSPSWSFGRRWLQANRSRIDVVHFHAVRRFWEYERTQARLRWVVRFARNLLFARALGYRTALTVHDLRPLEHSLKPGWVDYLGHWLAVRLTEAVFVHYNLGRRLVEQEYGRRNNLYAVSHPGYAGIYANTTTRAEARATLGLAGDDRVLTFFGGIRPNKGIDDLIFAFRRLPDSNLRLLIVGQPWPPASYVRELVARAQGDSRVRVVPARVPDIEVQTYMNASDAIVLPFRDILTSGSVLLAMSFARPVIASRLGCLPEVVVPDSGFLYDPTEPNALFNALRQACSADLETMGKAAGERAARYTWADLARDTITVYER